MPGISSVRNALGRCICGGPRIIKSRPSMSCARTPVALWIFYPRMATIFAPATTAPLRCRGRLKMREAPPPGDWIRWRSRCAIEEKSGSGSRISRPARPKKFPWHEGGLETSDMTRLADWLDERKGWGKFVHEALYENVPGGARWRYVWGSTLNFALAVQFITGIFLWMAYAPSSQTAWESVYYIQDRMRGGWLLRGLHHYTAQAMTVLLVLHLMQVVIDGAYKAPREINFWFGLVLLQLVLALSLTGYLLPWDQKGFWATKVATSLAAIVPVIGPGLQKIVIGGPDYGHHTLTRFFALHAGALPAFVVMLLVWHIFLFRRHGITAKDPKRKPDEYFWPDQVLKDAVACLAVLAAVLVLVLRPWIFHTGEDLGAELAAPADPSETCSAARPEWYFLFLFEFLKFFPGGTEIWGAIIIPGLVLLIIFLMPIVGRWKLGHRFNVGLSCSLLAGIIFLTFLALTKDRRDPIYKTAFEEARRNADRVKALARAK